MLREYQEEISRLKAMLRGDIPVLFEGNVCIFATCAILLCDICLLPSTKYTRNLI